MREPELMKFTVRPYSFVVFGHNVWEPQAPYDSIPYNLFACGIREMRIGATITLEELRECLTLTSLDPGRDLPPEDDIAAAFWEKNIPSVSYECAEASAEGDAGEREAFFEEADELAQQAENTTRQHQIIAEQESQEGQNLLPTSFMKQLIGFYGDNMGKLVPNYLEQSFAEFTKSRMNSAPR